MKEMPKTPLVSYNSTSSQQKTKSTSQILYHLPVNSNFQLAPNNLMMVSATMPKYSRPKAVNELNDRQLLK